MAYRNRVFAAKRPMKHFETSLRRLPIQGLRCSHAVSGNAQNDHEHFYQYTSGRWLWDEETRLQERYKQFNVPGLKSVATKATGAKSCISITKFAEGAFNKLFRLVMDDGSAVFARIPMPVAGPLYQTVASEVATMDYVSLHA